MNVPKYSDTKTKLEYVTIEQHADKQIHFG